MFQEDSMKEELSILKLLNIGFDLMINHLLTGWWLSLIPIICYDFTMHRWGFLIIFTETDAVQYFGVIFVPYQNWNFNWLKKLLSLPSYS